MIWLLLCVVLTTTFFIAFKLFDRFGLDTFQAIVFNYITCILVGLSFSYDVEIQPFLNDLNWLWYAVGLGSLFITTFFLMAKTAQEVSVAVSTVASKISMLIPSLVALYLYKEVRDDFSFTSVLGFILAILALVLITFKSQKELLEGKKTSWLLVLSVFFGTGTVDTIINVAGKRFDFADFNKGFPLVCFAIAAFGGSLVLIFVKKSKFEVKNLVGGFLLGIPNYFSIYTLMEGLTFYKGNAAMVYPIVHILSILLASFIAFLWFKEKLSLVNYLGAFFAIAAVLILSVF